MARFATDPANDIIDDMLRWAQESAHYAPWPGEPLHPFKPLLVWRIKNTDAGFWKRNTSVRSAGAAWWTDGMGRKHVMAHGDCGRRWLMTFPDGNDPATLVFRTARLVMEKMGFPETLFATMDNGLQAAIHANPADALTWLTAADWLEEHGHDATPIRQFFGAVFAA